MNDRVIGIILDEKEYRENDILLSIFSQQYGLLTLVAKGASKLKSKNSLCQIPYNEYEFIIDYQDLKTMFLMKKMSLITNNSTIISDLKQNSCAMVISEILLNSKLNILQLTEISNVYLQIKQCFHLLATKNDEILLLGLMLSQSLNILGLTPYVDGCVHCNNLLINQLSIVDGGFVCQNCQKSCGTLTKEQLKKFRIIIKANMQNYSSIQHIGYNKTDLEILIDFWQYHTGIKLKSYSFYQMI